jgi:hypothetical protein
MRSDREDRRTNEDILERRDDLAILLDEHSVLKSVGGLCMSVQCVQWSRPSETVNYSHQSVGSGTR